MYMGSFFAYFHIHTSYFMALVFMLEQVDNYLLLNSLILQIMITIDSRPNDLFTYQRGNITSIRKHVPEHSEHYANVCTLQAKKNQI